MTIQTYITNLCKHSGISEEDITIEVDETTQEDSVTVNITVPPEDSGLFIGYHGEALNAIQRLTRLVFQEQLGEKRVYINVNQYREQREEKLRARAQAAAEKVLHTSRQYVFEGLSSAERFIIHTAIGENEDYSELETVSEGEGRDRVLIVRFKAE